MVIGGQGAIAGGGDDGGDRVSQTEKVMNCYMAFGNEMGEAW